MLVADDDFDSETVFRRLQKIGAHDVRGHESLEKAEAVERDAHGADFRPLVNVVALVVLHDERVADAGGDDFALIVFDKRHGAGGDALLPDFGVALRHELVFVLGIVIKNLLLVGGS